MAATTNLLLTTKAAAAEEDLVFAELERELAFVLGVVATSEELVLGVLTLATLEAREDAALGTAEERALDTEAVLNVLDPTTICC